MDGAYLSHDKSSVVFCITISLNVLIEAIEYVMEKLLFSSFQLIPPGIQQLVGIFLLRL